MQTRAVRLIEIESQSRFETLRFANRKACDVDAILLWNSLARLEWQSY